MVARDDGCNVSHRNGDAWAYHCCAGVIDELFLGDRHNGVSVRRVGLGPENEQVARAQDKAVRGVCFLLVLWIRLAEMEFARLAQAQRNDGPCTDGYLSFCPNGIQCCLGLLDST